MQTQLLPSSSNKNKLLNGIVSMLFWLVHTLLEDKSIPCSNFVLIDKATWALWITQLYYYNTYPKIKS